ncbi:hypothetical protein DFH27DRAFT_140498 [Peziza echinospora]|nr:hypothetical protein DFH27DRAFT_140498 [Peziza echinospora]
MREWPLILPPTRKIWNRPRTSNLGLTPPKLFTCLDWEKGASWLDWTYMQRTHPLLHPVSLFNRLGNIQTTGSSQLRPRWREMADILPNLIVTRVPLGSTQYSYRSQTGIRRQELQIQVIYEEVLDINWLKARHSGYAARYYGRLVCDPDCDDIGEINIEGKSQGDGKEVALKILHHTVTHLRHENIFLVAAVYEDNAVFMFEVDCDSGYARKGCQPFTLSKLEPIYWGLKLGNFGTNIPRNAGIGRVKGKVKGMAFDARYFAEPGWPWDPDLAAGAGNWRQVERPVNLPRPASLALVLLVEGDDSEGIEVNGARENSIQPANLRSGFPKPPSWPRLYEEPVTGSDFQKMCTRSFRGIGNGRHKTLYGECDPETVYHQLGLQTTKEFSDSDDTASEDDDSDDDSEDDNSEDDDSGDDSPEDDDDDEESTREKSQLPQKPRWVVHTIHLQQGNNKDKSLIPNHRGLGAN